MPPYGSGWKNRYISDMEMVKCNMNDLPVYRELARQTFFDAYEKDTDPSDLQQYIGEHFSIEAITRELTDAHCAVFFLKDESKQVTGYVKLRWDTSHELLEGKPIELQRIYVKKEYYGKGYGKLLLDYAEAYGRDHGYDWIWLCVWLDNHGAIRFYRRNGWEQFGEIKFKFGDTIFNDPVFKKKL